MEHKIKLEKKHISEFKAKCNKGHNLMRSICSHEWGAHQHTCLAAHWTFIIFVNFSFCLFSRDFYESRWLFFFEGQ